MIPPDRLLASLLDLLALLHPKGIPVILGGGYGLYLKQRHLEQLGPACPPTLVPFSSWPEPRATNDLDIFLRPEVVTNADDMSTIRAVLDELAYLPVAQARFMQFVHASGVKIDLLAGPLDDYKDRSRTRRDERRTGPRRQVSLHARKTAEAVAYADGSAIAAIDITGLRSEGSPYSARLFVPPAFTYVVMKLFAFRDRHTNPEDDYARHHALDLYRTVIMMTEPEYDVARMLWRKHAAHPKVLEAASLARHLFRDASATGSLRIREHALLRSPDTLPIFLEALHSIIEPSPPSHRIGHTD